MEPAGDRVEVPFNFYLKANGSDTRDCIFKLGDYNVLQHSLRGRSKIERPQHGQICACGC